MTDKQTAIEALDKLAQCECVLAVQGYIDCVEVILSALQSKPVDVDLKELQDEIENLIPEGLTYIGMIAESITDHLHENGYLNTPQTEDTE